MEPSHNDALILLLGLRAAPARPASLLLLLLLLGLLDLLGLLLLQGLLLLLLGLLLLAVHGREGSAPVLASLRGGTRSVAAARWVLWLASTDVPFVEPRH
jgi:hypothetical protein